MSHAAEEEIDGIYNTLEQGDLEQALVDAETLAARYPEDPDSLLALAAAQLESEHFQDALQTIDRARQLEGADQTLVLGMEGSVHYEVGEFEEARVCFETILKTEPERLEAWIDLSYTAEHLGDLETAKKAYEKAVQLDPDALPPSLRLTPEEFDVHLHSAIESLPEEIQNLLEAVPIVVQPLPPAEMLGEDGISPDTLGLFVGRDLTEQSTSDVPDGNEVVFLFQRNIERLAADEDELVDQIHITLYHELGHLLGWDEEDLEERGLE